MPPPHKLSSLTFLRNPRAPMAVVKLLRMLNSLHQPYTRKRILVSTITRVRSTIISRKGTLVEARMDMALQATST
jgi:hypothetical protein